MAADTNRISQASVVPFRFGETGLEICLITARRSQRWGFPKGGLSGKETIPEAALKEALEEAGLRGIIVGPPLAIYEYSKRGQRRSVTVMLMEVQHCDDVWHESHERERCWASLAEARLRIERPNLIQLLQTAIDRVKSLQDGEFANPAIRA